MSDEIYGFIILVVVFSLGFWFGCAHRKDLAQAKFERAYQLARWGYLLSKELLQFLERK